MKKESFHGEMEHFDPEKVGKAIAHILSNRGMGEVKFIGATKKTKAEKSVEETA